MIALTGSTASGKSTLARFLRQRGLTVADADEFLIKLFAKNEIKDILQARFGLKVFRDDASVDTEILFTYADVHPDIQLWLARIFAQPLKEALELWLFVQQRAHQKLVFVADGYLRFAFSALSLAQTWQLSADEEIRWERLQARDHLTGDCARQRLETLDALANKSNFTHLLTNNGTFAQLQKNLDTLLNDLPAK